MWLLCYIVLAVMTGETDRCTLIHVGHLINSTQAAQNRNLPHSAHLHCMHYNTTSQEVWLHCTCVGPFSPATTGKNTVGWGLQSTHGLPWYSVMPQWRMSPQYIGKCDQLHAKRDVVSVGRWSKNQNEIDILLLIPLESIVVSSQVLCHSWQVATWQDLPVWVGCVCVGVVGWCRMHSPFQMIHSLYIHCCQVRPTYIRLWHLPADCLSTIGRLINVTNQS